MNKDCFKPERREEEYLAPEVSVIELGTESIICASDPYDNPGDLGGGGWL